MPLYNGTPTIGQTVTKFGRTYVYTAKGWGPAPDPSVLRVQDVRGGSGVLVMKVGTEPTSAPPTGYIDLIAVATGMKAKDPTGAVGFMPPISLPNIVLTQTAVAAVIVAGKRTLPVTCAGVKVGDGILLFPTAPLPSGYAIGNVWVSAANTIQVVVEAPLLAVGASYSITCKVIAERG